MLIARALTAYNFYKDEEKDKKATNKIDDALLDQIIEMSDKSEKCCH